jgi:phosphoglycerate dehydrogenase-like enzyme
LVVLAAPLTRETERMIDARALAAMKPSAYFINVGRGASVDEAALAQALAERRIAGAAVDVSRKSRRRPVTCSTVGALPTT